MKNIFKIGTLALCLVVGLSSCNDFFDAIPGEQYDLEDTFTNRSKTEQFLNNVYNYVPDETLERSARNTMSGFSVMLAFITGVFLPFSSVYSCHSTSM